MSWVGPLQEMQERMGRDLRLTFVERERHRSRRLGDHPHAAMRDGIAGEPGRREVMIIALPPIGLAHRIHRDERMRGGVFSFNEKRFQFVEHFVPSFSPFTGETPGAARQRGNAPHARPPPLPLPARAREKFKPCGCAVPSSATSIPSPPTRARPAGRGFGRLR